MLTPFDWLRKCQSGAELITTLKILETRPDILEAQDVGPPHSAFGGPCQRCWVYPRIHLQTQQTDKEQASHKSDPEYLNTIENTAPYCRGCKAILDDVWHHGNTSRNAAVVWGFVNQLPRGIVTRTGFYQEHAGEIYIHDTRHFLMTLPKRHLQAWLQEIILYQGVSMTGLLQIIPTTGGQKGDSMGALLARMPHYEIDAAPDRLLIHFYSAPYQLLRSYKLEKEGVRTFEINEFTRMLEMAAVFRTILYPDIQQMLRELLTLDDAKEAGFYWGRFLGLLTPEARDMLNAWRIRTWPQPRLNLFYALMEYVYVDFSRTP